MSRNKHFVFDGRSELYTSLDLVSETKKDRSRYHVESGIKYNCVKVNVCFRDKEKEAEYEKEIIKMAQHKKTTFCILKTRKRNHSKVQH